MSARMTTFARPQAQAPSMESSLPFDPAEPMAIAELDATLWADQS